MPTYEHICTHCKHEWEEFYSITRDPPSLCPGCNIEGNVKRLVSGGATHIMRLTGRELSEHNRAAGKKIAQEAMKNENVKANLIGEDRYHNQLLQTSKLTDELVHIGKDAPKPKIDVGKQKKGLIKRVK